MIFNITNILNSDSLLEKEQAEELIKQLSDFDWVKLKKVVLSFKETKLINLNFLIPFVEFLHNVDMQDLDDEISVKIEMDNELHRELLLEAYKTIREREI